MPLPRLARVRGVPWCRAKAAYGMSSTSARSGREDGPAAPALLGSRPSGSDADQLGDSRAMESGGTTEQALVAEDTTQVVVRSVLPGEADAAVQLHRLVRRRHGSIQTGGRGDSDGEL